MRIENKTKYDKKTLRKLFFYCLKHEGLHNTKNRLWIVKYSKKSYRWQYGYTKEFYDQSKVISGWAIYNSSYVELHIPRYFCNGKTLAQVIFHELGHNRGLRHKDQAKWWKFDLSNLPIEFHRIEEVPNAKND